MSKQNEKEIPKNTVLVYRLAHDLLKAFYESELCKKGKENKFFPFDIMLGIGVFTHHILKALELSSKVKTDFHRVYSEEVLKNIVSPLDSINPEDPTMGMDASANNELLS